MRLVRGALRAWRDSFDCGGRSVAMWFPGHMAKGLRQMKGKLQKVDCLVEVHDARIPFSGRNPVFQEALGVRPHLLLLNKMDLADLKEKSRILEQLKQEGLKNVIFTDCEREENIKEVVPLITELVSSNQRYQRAENVEYCIMVIGVPNVGKSSLINALRRLHLKKGKASQVGGEPGITKAVLTKIQVSERPVMYLIDTPGVLSPRIGSVETGLKLALCGTIRDYLVGEDVMADYLLYNLNKHQLFKCSVTTDQRQKAQGYGGEKVGIDLLSRSPNITNESCIFTLAQGTGLVQAWHILAVLPCWSALYPQ
ncbi:mitochondrial ribosome-associated GTPase 1 isoform X2 [Alligator mississippiensis]|uniref:mitochondrial ribosome-associated GTPase 1 isoform X2 n=1 Tax=Alligator mississippiensis TaxID=8496 RepID=UPI002878114A|nr:mitochondrial ribosome-associated GTPase 1 isoform X2 [Alligator mississippiensis]